MIRLKPAAQPGSVELQTRISPGLSRPSSASDLTTQAVPVTTPELVPDPTRTPPPASPGGWSRSTAVPLWRYIGGCHSLLWKRSQLRIRDAILARTSFV